MRGMSRQQQACLFLAGDSCAHAWKSCRESRTWCQSCGITCMLES